MAAFCFLITSNPVGWLMIADRYLGLGYTDDLWDGLYELCVR